MCSLRTSESKGDSYEVEGLWASIAAAAGRLGRNSAASEIASIQAYRIGTRQAPFTGAAPQAPAPDFALQLVLAPFSG